jgi:hypothetical protein
VIVGWTPHEPRGTIVGVIRRLLESGMPWKAASALLGACVIGVAAFWLTSSTATYTYLGPLCLTGIVREPGFDPWTGQPYGTIYLCTNDLPGLGDGSTREVTDGPPDDLVGRWAIPVPVGTALGFLLLGGLATYSERRSRTFTTDVEPIPDGR